MIKKIFAALFVLLLAFGSLAIFSYSPEAQARGDQISALIPGIQARQTAELNDYLTTSTFWQGVRRWAFGTFSEPVAMLGNIALYGLAVTFMAGCTLALIMVGDHYQRVTTFTTQTIEHSGLKVVLVRYRLGHGKNRMEGIRVLEIGTGARGNFLDDALPSPEKARLTALLLQVAADVKIEEAKGRSGVRVL